MGMFDSMYDANGFEWQTKAFDCLLSKWRIGDSIPSAPLDHQVKVIGGRGDSYGSAFATIRRGRLAVLPDERDESLPLLDYSGGWLEIPDGVDVVSRDPFRDGYDAAVRVFDEKFFGGPTKDMVRAWFDAERPN